MAKRLTNRQRLASKIENLTESEAAEILEHISLMERARPLQTSAPEDELVNSLADLPENCCARQVLEWDKVRRRADLLALFGQAAIS